MAGDGETLGMNSRRVSALPVFMLAAIALALTGCQTERRTHAPAAASRSAVLLLLVSESGNLTAEQLQSHRDEVVRYVTERGLLAPDDVLVNGLAAADRIIRAVIGDAGGFKLAIFNQGGVGIDPTGAPRRVYWTSASPDPFFDAGYSYRDGPDAGYFPYLPRELPRSRNPNAPPTNQPRPNHPPTTNPPTQNPPPKPPDTHPPRPRHNPDTPDIPRPPHRPPSSDHPGNTPRPPRDNPPPRPPPTYTPPPAPSPQPTRSESSRPTVQKADERRDDGKSLPER